MSGDQNNNYNSNTNRTYKVQLLDLQGDDSVILELLREWESIGGDFNGEVSKDTDYNYKRYVQDFDEGIEPERSDVVDNRLFMTMETIIPLVTAKPALPVVHNRRTSRSKAENKKLTELHQKVIINEYEEQEMQEKMERVIRNWFISRIAFIRYYIERGTIKTRVVDPCNILVERYITDLREAEFIGEKIVITAKELVDRYPDKKQAIYDKVGDKEYLGSKVEIIEWRTRDSYVVQYDDIILDKGETQYFINKDQTTIIDDYGNEITTNEDDNFLEDSLIPYISLSVYKYGKELRDPTTPLIQSIKLQNELNNRMRQVDDAAETIANAHLIGRGLTAEQIDSINNKKKTGDAIGLTADQELEYLNPPSLPSYVQDTITDTRNEIDNIFGTHGTTRGERGSAETATGREILRQGDEDRQALLGRALERMMGELYNVWTQLIKMYYTEDILERILGKKDAEIYYNYMHNGEEDGLEIKIKPGSMLPDDKIAIKAEALQLAQMGLITKEELYERLGWEEATEKADALQKEVAIEQKKQQEILAQGEQNTLAAQQGQQDLQNTMAQIQQIGM